MQKPLLLVFLLCLTPLFGNPGEQAFRTLLDKSIDNKVEDLLIHAVGMLDDRMSKEEKGFLIHMKPSSTVEWLRLKKRDIFEIKEFDKLRNDPDFWKYVNIHYYIVHRDEFFITVVCATYYSWINGKFWDLDDSFQETCSYLATYYKIQRVETIPKSIQK